MSLNPAPTKAPPGLSEGSEVTVLRLHDGTESVITTAPRLRAIALQTPETVGIWRQLIDEFLDRRASHRFQHDAESYLEYRWKPKLALVLPESFSLERPTHRRDLAVALELLASVLDHYNFAVVSNSRDAVRLFRKVLPFSHEAISGCAGALVLLSRSLNDEVGAIRPSRYVAADPCAYRINKQRIVFAASGVEFPVAPVNDGEIGQGGRECVSVLLDEDEDVPSFFEAMRRLRAQGVPLRITLSSRADDEFARKAHAAFADDPRVDVRDPEPCGLEHRSEFRVSNDLIALLTQRPSTLPRYLFRRGAYWRVGSHAPRRSDLYLFRGEEANAHGLLGTWIGERETTAPPPSTVHLAGAVEPLVSVVVPVHDRAIEILRLAHSIYAQDYPWIEVVFVTHGSPVESIEAIRAAENYLMKRRFRVRIIELARAYGSPSIPLDFGIRASSGDLICVLHSDDWLESGFFSFLRGMARRDDTLYYPVRVYPDVGRAMGGNRPCEPPIPGLGVFESADLASALRRRGNFMGDSGVCFARALFDRAGGIDHRLDRGAALYLWWRSALAGARAEEHVGRVNIARHPGNAELSIGETIQPEGAWELARGEELIEWL